MNEENKERPEQEPLVWPDEPKGPIRNGNRGGRRDWLVYVAVGMAVLAIGCIVGVGIWYYSGGGDAEPQAVAEDSLLSEGSARDSLSDVSVYDPFGGLSEAPSSSAEKAESVPVPEDTATAAAAEEPAPAPEVQPLDDAQRFFSQNSTVGTTRYSGSFVSDKGESYPIQLIFSVGKDYKVSSCTFVNVNYDARLKMSVHFSGNEMILTSKGSNFSMQLSPDGAGRWQGTAFDGSRSMAAALSLQ